MIGTKALLVGALACAASVGAVASIAPAAPDDLTDPRMAAAHAADCAGFPAHMVQVIKKYYDPEGEVVLEQLPPTYEVKRVQLHVTYGGCKSEFADTLPTSSVLLTHASGFLDTADKAPGALPFYVVAQVGGTGADPIYLLMRLPAPSMNPEPQRTPGTLT